MLGAYKMPLMGPPPTDDMEQRIDSILAHRRSHSTVEGGREERGEREGRRGPVSRQDVKLCHLSCPRALHREAPGSLLSLAAKNVLSCSQPRSGA